MMRLVWRWLARWEQAPMLGRWTLWRCERKVAVLVRQANEDHCGVCDVKI